ncbi:DNA topoisomerase I [Marinobacterium weihaiense]|uniref:DNA topoisomerase I n=1 Tax=Marinobacterium weihaiense TaxID=2851016 RepID=A0ABS6M6P3_9GAMM|nr:DNA topoisomerase I [Marinobacterium weihaiense]MBV0931949.1 DNA topoisomerase I [Marinobacterium weihaiense]
MLGDNLYLVLLIAGVGILALVVNYVVTTREQESEARRERLDWLQTQAEHTLNALAVLKETGCRQDIVDKLNQHAMALIEEISLLAPDSELMTQVSDLKETSDRTRPDKTRLNSDRAVKRAQIYINFAEKLLIQMAKAGKMTGQLARTYQEELYWLNVSLVADAHRHQATRLLEMGDKHTALTHLKHAKAVLVRATAPQRQKKPKLDEIQASIDGIQPRRNYGAGALAESLDDYLNEQP